MNEITDIYKLYQNGISYNNKLSPPYYKTIDINEKFDNNIHWDGVKANGQPALIFPIYSRTADFEIASILSSPVAIKFSVENQDGENPDEELQRKVDMLNHTCKAKWEKDKLDAMLRDLLRDGFNSGDYAVYTYWDKSKSTKQYSGKTIVTDKSGEPVLDENGEPKTEEVEIKGDFCNELKDGSEIMFGNPNDRRVQTQPYILVTGRALVSDLKKEAKANKIPKDEYEKITGDKDTNETAGERGKIEIDGNDEDGSAKCLYIIKLWKKDGQVYYRKTTKFCEIIKEQSMNLKRYPIAFSNWKKRKNSYHGMAPGTALVPNQVAINKAYSSIMHHLNQTAFGKVIYDSNRIAGWDNRVGAAIPMNGDITGAVQQLPPGVMNTQMPDILDGIVSKTKELNGASDASLGDVNPEQASGASIAYTQKASAIPLDNPKNLLYDFVEDLALNWQDFIENKYTIPRKIGYEEKGVAKVGEINGSDYKDLPLSLKIDVGPSTQWSEIASVNTLNNLLAGKQITFLQYLERLPDGFIEDKQGLIDEIKQQMEQQQLMMEQQQQMQMQQQGMQNQQMQQQGQQEQAQRESQFEKMASFLDSLPQETQDKIMSLPEDQQEATIMQLMKQSVNQSMK